MRAEGVEFKASVDVGRDIAVGQLRREFDAVCLACGAMQARDLPVPGRELAGVHFAMDYLTRQNRLNAGDPVDSRGRLTAEGKRVVIIGGGDTGSDCLGTCHRQGAKEVYQFELLSQPPPARSAETPWPLWPMMLRSSHAHEEGCRREWSVSTKRFSGENGRVARLHAARVEMKQENGRFQFVEIPGTDFEIGAELVLLAMGFVGPVRQGLISDLGLSLDSRGNVAVNQIHMTSVDGVFAAGDVKRGASLIVWAIREGRDAARGIDEYLRVGKSFRSV
jgi:glutamate synthase (NADPH/NADH) small chain